LNEASIEAFSMLAYAWGRRATQKQKQGGTIGTPPCVPYWNIRSPQIVLRKIIGGTQVARLRVS